MTTYGNLFTDEDDMNYHSKGTSVKEPRKRKAGEKGSVSVALLSCSIFTTEPTTQPAEVRVFRTDMEEKTDLNFSRLSPEQQKRLGNPNPPTFAEIRRLLTDGSAGPLLFMCSCLYGMPTVDKMSPDSLAIRLGPTGHLNVLIPKEGGAHRGAHVTLRRNLSLHEFLELTEQAIPGGEEEVRRLKEEYEKRFLIEDCNGNLHSTGNKDNKPTPHFIGYRATATGGKNADVVLVKKQGLGRVTKSISAGGIGMLLGRRKKDGFIKMESFKPVDPSKPDGVKFLVVRGLIYVEMHTSVPSDWGKAINEKELQKVIEAW